jgi:phage-related tail protein
VQRRTSMNIEFIISLGITVFSAGIVFGILKAQVSHLENELKAERNFVKDATDRLERNTVEKYQSVKERIDKSDGATASVGNNLTAITQSLKYIEISMNEIKERIGRLENKRSRRTET